MPLGEPEGSPTIFSIPPGGQDVNTRPRGGLVPVENRAREDASNRKVNAFAPPVSYSVGRGTVNSGIPM